ncbi:beta-ketoacyl synthase N-terminal-like domain-containing protein [Archangium sp.]|uniref:beta-ketoacyl synthase N-terminal-like domain-containing protein n=1 Tax=Archangium sp. TaxID=1872627 RepID=UPI002D2BA4B5|nr:beta-ketoacyl synthase N-terminal-like domain-containing protein [Archangium sp.]HYO59312.1 beta-ketoacyl synthase N-terminal-like domain-containing protein [Archangium sp.]
MSSPVHIVAIGARTPVGLTAESAAAAVRARISRIAEHPFLVDLRGERVRVARDGLIDPGLFGVPRMLALARFALEEVIGKLGPRAPSTRMALLVSLSELRPGWTERDIGAVEQELALPLGPMGWKPQVIPGGHAAALEALRRGAELIGEGRADLCLVGGVESYLNPDTLLWLDTNRQLLRSGTRSAFHPGEGAGFLALAGERVRRQLGLRSLGIMLTVQVSRESKLIKTDKLSTGEGLTRAIQAATAELRGRGERVDDVYCDLNGERYRTEEWGFALLRTQEAFRDVSAARTAVSEWGDVGAASGALLSILALRAWARGYARGPTALVWASSEGGLRGAVLLRRAESEGRL